MNTKDTLKLNLEFSISRGKFALSHLVIHMHINGLDILQVVVIVTLHYFNNVNEY